MKLKILFPLFIACLFIACGDDDDDGSCDTNSLTYSNIAPILTTCTDSGCHEAGSVNGSLASYVDVKAFSDNGGNIIGSIKHEDGVSPMPQGAEKLSSCNISKIETWINDGLPE